MEHEWLSDEYFDDQDRRGHWPKQCSACQQQVPKEGYDLNKRGYRKSTICKKCDAPRKRAEGRATKFGIPARVYDELKANRVCGYCRLDIPEGHHHIDHRIPKARGGGKGLDNLIVACSFCNQAKGMLTEREFMASGFPDAVNSGEVIRKLGKPTGVKKVI